MLENKITFGKWGDGKCMKIKKTVCILLISSIFCSLFTGCFDRKEIDELTYVVAIGYDKGKVNAIRLTLQYAIPTAVSGSAGGGGGGDSGSKGSGAKNLSTVTVDTPSIFSGINMANNFVGKQLNLSHAIVAVFSEELAKEGKMHDYIHAMNRDREFRPNMFIAVARKSAEEYIRSVKPIQELDPAKYYELKFTTYDYTGFTANTRFNNFYFKQEKYTVQPVAVLLGLGTFEKSDDLINQNSTYREKGRDKPLMGDYKAGDIPKVGNVKGETMGLAVFNGSKMVGELDGQEATYYLIVSGEYNHSYVTIPDPKKVDSYVILDLKQSRRPQYKVDFVNGKPVINVKVRLEANYLSIQSGVNYEEDGLRKLFEKSAQQFFKEDITRFLDKTAKVYSSDICGFGRSVVGKFLTWKEWKDFNWLGKYKDATFNVDVDLKVRRPGLMIRSLPDINTSGKGEQ